MALQKLRKLRDTIRSLPATAQREQLVEAVKAHPVVLVAGAVEGTGGDGGGGCGDFMGIVE